MTNTTSMKKATEASVIQSWVGFVCRDCGAPLALHRSNNGSRPGERSLRGWRITCPSCGVPDFYELGTAMVRITATYGALGLLCRSASESLAAEAATTLAAHPGDQPSGG